MDRTMEAALDLAASFHFPLFMEAQSIAMIMVVTAMDDECMEEAGVAAHVTIEPKQTTDMVSHFIYFNLKF